MSRYVRHQSVVTRTSDDQIDDDHWLKQFAKSLEKDAVQSRQVDQTLFHQINTIMNTKSKYPSVAAAVEDMKERSGLTAYLNKINKTSEVEPVTTSKTSSKVKAASDSNNAVKKKVDVTPIVIRKFPGIQTTLENHIKDSKGNLSIPAIIDKIRSIHQKDVSDAKDWEDDKLMLLVSKLNLDAKKNNPNSYDNFSNLGKREQSNDDIDPSNSDAFHSLNPVKL
jgi:hypothetical protein